MIFQRCLLSQMVMGTFATAIFVAAPSSYAGFEIVGNTNTPYVYQLSGAPRKVVDVREERIIGATANTVHRGQVDMELVMIPVAANKGVDMLTALRGIVPESQGWRVFSLRGVNTRAKVEWNSATNWLSALDSLMLRHKLIAEINWGNREITLAPFSNKLYAAQLRNQSKQQGIIRQVIVRQQYETPEPLLSLRLQPAQAAHTEARSVAVNSIDVPVRALAEVAERPAASLQATAVSQDSIEQLVNQRVEQATREKLAQLQALEAQYREKLEQLSRQANQIKETQREGKLKSPAPGKSAISLPSQSDKLGADKMEQPMKSDLRYTSERQATNFMRTDLRHEVFDEELAPETAGLTELPKSADAAEVAAAPATLNAVVQLNMPLQTGMEIQQAPRTKWEVSPQDKTLKNAMMRMAARNGYSLSYQTQDQEIQAPGTYYGTFDEALRELELASGKRIRTIESKLLGRLIIVTD